MRGVFRKQKKNKTSYTMCAEYDSKQSKQQTIQSKTKKTQAKRKYWRFTDYKLKQRLTFSSV